MIEASSMQQVFQHFPIGAVLLSASDDPVVLDVNQAFLQPTDLTHASMVGRRLFEIFPADPTDPADGSESELRASIRAALATRLPQPMQAQRYPVRRVLPNGETVFEERFWNATNTPVLRADGSVGYLLHTTQEVTSQIRAEAARRQSELDAHAAALRAEAERDRLRAVVRAVPVGIVVSDAAGRMLLVNEAHGALWGGNPARPRNVQDFERWTGWWADGSARHGRPLEPHDWPTARLLHGEETVREVVEIARFGSGERRIVLFTGAPVHGATGTVIGAVVAEMDITDRIRAEESLRQADRRKDEFLAMLAHELRNPLAPIAAAADVLAMEVLDRRQVQQASSVISRQVHHMRALVDDLLDLSRVTRGLAVLEKSPVDLKRVVADSLEQVRPLIESRGHRVLVHTPPGPATVCGDAKRLVQVVSNLVTNAAKYTPDGGRIVIDLRLQGDVVEVSIEDTGVGMPPALVEQVFDLFVQGDRSMDRSQGGLGIGLALVKRLVELHAGHVKAESAGVGRGSTFTVCIPRLEVAGHVPTEPGGAASPRKADARLQVMVVDDNHDAAAMLALLVETFGHAVTVEHHPQRALARLDHARPDVFLLDIGLPDMDGMELARRLRRDPRASAAMLVAVTGYGQDRERDAAREAGFDHYLVKPVECAVLADLLDRPAAGTAAPRASGDG